MMLLAVGAIMRMVFVDSSGRGDGGKVLTLMMKGIMVMMEVMFR